MFRRSYQKVINCEDAQDAMWGQCESAKRGWQEKGKDAKHGGSTFKVHVCGY